MRDDTPAPRSFRLLSDAAGARVPVRAWVYEPGVPASAPRPTAEAFAQVEQQARGWARGEVPATQLAAAEWSTHEWLHFLKALPERLSRGQMAALDRAFELTAIGNSEIAHQWLLMAVTNRYEPAYARLAQYLMGVGRRKLIKLLYDELVKTPAGRTRASAIYARARAGYHPIVVRTLDPIVGWGAGRPDEHASPARGPAPD